MAQEVPTAADVLRGVLFPFDPSCMKCFQRIQCIEERWLSKLGWLGSTVV
jgi:hypothetical protein